MTKRSRFAQIILLSLFLGAVLFGVGTTYQLSKRIDSIRTAEQSDPLWIGSQLLYELLRLEKELGEVALGFKPATNAALRFDIAWSRVNVLQEGKLAGLLAEFDIDQAVLAELETTFKMFETEIRTLAAPDISSTARHEKAKDILAALEGYDLAVRSFLLELAEAKTVTMSDFRMGMLNLSHTVAYIGVTILTLFGIFVFLLFIELKTAKTTEREMRILAEEATSASRLKLNFMSVVSHELRTPLTSILGGLALLEVRVSNAIDDAASLKLLNMAKRNGDRLLTLVNDILDAQALSEGKVAVKRELADLNQIIADAVENCHTYAEQLGVGYHIIAPKEELKALTDSARVTQVLVNLLSNAAKFTSSGDIVEICAKRHGQSVRIEITDRGIGIPADRLSDIFTPFHQINPGTTGENKSSGLGLSITKQLMDLLGGDIGVRSVEGIGSVFWIELNIIPKQNCGLDKLSSDHPLYVSAPASFANAL